MSSFEGSGRELPTSPPPPIPEPSSESSEATSPPPPSSPPPSGPPSEKRASDDSIGPPPDIDAEGNTRDTPAHALEPNEEMPPSPPTSPSPGPRKLDSAGNNKEPPIDLELNGLEPVTVHFLNNSYVFKQQKTNISQLIIVFFDLKCCTAHVNLHVNIFKFIWRLALLAKKKQKKLYKN